MPFVRPRPQLGRFYRLLGRMSDLIPLRITGVLALTLAALGFHYLGVQRSDLMLLVASAIFVSLAAVMIGFTVLGAAIT
ncbi:MAG: hypothetical protein AB1758_13945, partial [Candidatus Eremiobacterota bacterium]